MIYNHNSTVFQNYIKERSYMKKFKAKIKLAKTSPELEKLLMDSQKLDSTTPAFFPIQVIFYEGSKFYCCISGGFLDERNVPGSFLRIENDPPLSITEMGFCTFTALKNLEPIDSGIIFSEIYDGPTPTLKKMITTFKKAQELGYQKICFLVKIDSQSHKNILKSLDITAIK